MKMGISLDGTQQCFINDKHGLIILRSSDDVITGKLELQVMNRGLQESRVCIIALWNGSDGNENRRDTSATGAHLSWTYDANDFHP